MLGCAVTRDRLTPAAIQVVMTSQNEGVGREENEGCTENAYGHGDAVDVNCRYHEYTNNKNEKRDGGDAI